MSTFKITLPPPPSVNRAYRSIVGRSKTGKPVSRVIMSAIGKEYKAEVLKRLMMHRFEPLTGRLKMSIEYVPPNRIKRDLDNLFKLLLDSLESGDVFENDNQIDVLTIKRMPVDVTGCVRVFIEEIGY